MAIDQAKKAFNMADETIEAAKKFMEAIETLRNLEDERVGAGLTLTNFNTTYEGNEGLKHVDGAALNAVLNTSIPAIWTFMTTNNHDDNLQKVRP